MARGVHHPGRAVQIDPIKPTLKAPGAKRLNLKYDELLSNVAFNFNLRRYILGQRFAVNSMELLRQGLTLVHFSAQPEPYLTRNTPFTPPNTPRHLLNTRKTTPKQSLNAPPIPQKALTLSQKVDECKALC